MNSATNTTYINNFNIVFNKINVEMEDKSHFAIFYRCTECGKYLLSKTGAYSHKCTQAIAAIQIKNEKQILKTAYEYFLRFIATSNISFRAAEDKNLQKAFGTLDQNFVIPNRHKLCSDLILLSEDIHNKMLQNLQGKTVSLLCDGCSRWGTKYQGVIVYTCQRLYVFSIYDIPNFQSLTIAKLIAEVVTKLKDNKTTVVSVCVDNARYNIKALNGQSNSAQELSGQFFIRMPCAAHTANLAIKDFFNDVEFHFIYYEIEYLLNNKPEKSTRDGFSPKLINERWDSLYKCVKFIKKNRNLYEELNIQKVNKSLKNIDDLIGWENLKEILKIMWNLIQKVEKNYSCVADIIPSYLFAISQLQQIDQKASQKMAYFLKKRFYSTLPLNLPMFAFLLTKNGLQYYRTYHLSESNILESSINGLIGYQVERNFDFITRELNRFNFINYLLNFDISLFDKFQKPIDLWIELSKSKSGFLCPSFISLAIEVLQIPASEAAVERLFTALSRATRQEMCNSHVESLNSRLIVKFDSIFEDIGAIEWEEFDTRIKKIDI